jgi:hypothetical protein
MARADRDPAPQFVCNTQNIYKFASGKDKVGRIDAISAETGKTVWSFETRASNYSPILATGGGLVFNGGMDRYLRAFDADSGQLLWQTWLASQARYLCHRWPAIYRHRRRRRFQCRRVEHESRSRRPKRRQRDVRFCVAAIGGTRDRKTAARRNMAPIRRAVYLGRSYRNDDNQPHIQSGRSASQFTLQYSVRRKRCPASKDNVRARMLVANA